MEDAESMNRRARQPFRDDPPPEQQIAVLFERLGNFMEETRRSLERQDAAHKQTNDLMAGLLRRETERNSHISELLQSRDDLEVWSHKHDDWHGPNDYAIKGRIGSRLDSLEADHHDADVRRGVWSSQWKAFTACAAAGASLTAILLNLQTIIGWLGG